MFGEGDTQGKATDRAKRIVGKKTYLLDRPVEQIGNEGNWESAVL